MHFSHTPPRFALPPGACDCHMHVFGGPPDFPFAPGRSYTPPPATVEDYRRLTRFLGIERNVYVQGSAHGTDNSCLLAALSVSGESSRGVAVIGAETSEAELAQMTKAGVCGARVNLATFGVKDSDFARRSLRETAARIRDFGWHIQLFAHAQTIADIRDLLPALGLPVVLDHMGLPKAALGLAQPGFAEMIGLVEDGIWVKVSGVYRVSEAAPDYADAAPFAEALLRANPGRVVWGSDWPHTGQHANAHLDEAPFTEFRPLDDGAMLSLLPLWTGEEALTRRVLVDNPAELYRF